MLSVRNLRHSAGMSLIELVVTLAIIGIVFSLGLPSYQVWIQNTKIRTAAESILNGMQLARAEAVRRNTNVGFYLVSALDASCADDATSSNWLVSIQDPVGLCNVAPSDSTAPQIIQKRSQQEGTSNVVTVTTLPAGMSSVNFTPLGRTTNTTNDLTQVDIAATDPLTGSRPLRVLIGAGGAIKMCDPLLPSSGADPRRC